MQTSEDTGEIIKALTKFQSEMQPIIRNAEGNTGNRPYTYADLAQTLSGVQPVLTENEMSITTSTAYLGDGMALVTTRLMHISGQWVECDIPMPCVGVKFQDMGKVVAYGRRYGMKAVLNLADVDDDGQSAQQAPAKAKPEAEKVKAAAAAKAKAEADAESKVINDAQRRLMRATQKDKKMPDGDLKKIIKDIACVDSSKLIPKPMFDAILNKMADWKPPEEDDLPF